MKTNKTNLNLILKQCLQTIHKHQSDDGGFYHESFSEKEQRTATRAFRYKTTFVTGLILRTLTNQEVQKAYNDANSKQITEQAARFLLKEKSVSWTWNYFSKESQHEFPQFNFPDDLDDTFICLSALYSWNKSLFNGEAWAHITQTLIKAEAEVGGPYHTWITDYSKNPKWKDIDMAVNANIAYFLHLSHIEVPRLQNYLNEGAKYLSSPYYDSSVILSYYLCFTMSSKNLLRVPKEDSLLEHALALSSALRRNSQKKTIETLLEKMLYLYQENSFHTEPFCIDPSQQGERHFCGSPALTAVFVLEALCLYTRYESKRPKKDTLYFLTTRAKKFIPPDIITAALGKRTDEIIDHPILFAEALGLSRNTGKALARANFFGWVAYYITDNILDDSTHTNIRNISIAHICLRKMYFIHQKYISKERLRFCYRVLNKMDFVQHRDEVSEDKSLGQALPFVILLFLKGCAPISPQVKNMILFWRKYLSARQLSDDAHDWKDDLEAGISNEALLFIQKHTTDPLHYDEVFWKTAFAEIIKEIKHLLDEAQRAIDPIERDTSTRIFSDLITKARKELARATTEKEYLENFALHYMSPQTPEFREHKDR